MFEFPLISRIGGALAEVTLKDGRRLVIDISPTAIAAVSPLRRDDIVLHDALGRGTVLGVRAGALAVKYESGVRLGISPSREAATLSHLLLDRPGRTIITMPTIDGEWAHVERTSFSRLDPGCIVASAEWGIGQYLGLVDDRPAFNFLYDRGCIRLLPIGSSLTILRANSLGTAVGCMGMDGNPLVVDVGAISPFLPGDYISYRGQCALCVGGSDHGMVVETDEMMLCGLGVGVFGSGEGELLARVAGAGKRRVKTESGEPVDVSVNTRDFERLALLPLDRILIDGVLAVVVGVRDGEVYVQEEGKEYVVRLVGEFRIVMRRFNVPTEREVHVKFGEREFTKIWLHAEAYRGMWFWPGDIVRQEGDLLRVMGLLDRRLFLVEVIAEKRKEVRNLNPCGIMAADLERRPIFVD
jgi:hypothetical protein